MAEPQTPVLVVGAGPAGLVMSLLLSQQRVPHVLVEKYPTMAHTPRAHIINQRTVEILRDLGLEETLYEVAMPWDQMRNTVWHTSLNGLELGRRQSWGTSPERHADYVQASPSQMANCGQHLLEPALLDAVQASPWVDLRLGSELVALDQDPRGVTATLQDRHTEHLTTIRADYLVGADGGRSIVAKSIGLEYEGEEGVSASATIHFHADLSRFTAHRPGTLYWNASPGSSDYRGYGNLICHQPWHDWALAFSYDPDDLDPADERLARERLHRIIGDDSVEVDIQNISTWTINHLVATSYQVGRVFCMGDAVHRHPPTNGLGLNTSVADAHNLAWKLTHVVRGVAHESLLDTYSIERQPIGRQVVDRAFASIGDMLPIAQALGFEPGQDERQGQEALRALYAPGPDGAARREALAKAIERTDHQFNAHGVEVGYRYRAGAVVPDGTPEPTPTRDPELYYDPTTWPGSHLPHAWIDNGSGLVSTYDVGAHGGFLLITGIGGEAWAAAADRASRELGADVAVVAVGTADGYSDVYGDWYRLRGVGDSGCVLVRPDLHVGWRSQDAAPDHVAKLTEVLARLLSS